MRAVLVAAGLIVLYYLLPLDRPFTVGTVVALMGGLSGVAVVLAWNVRVISRSPYPRLRAVEALVTTLSLFLVLFAGAYFVMSSSVAGSFSEPLSRTDSLYFTVTIVSTVGFGDITARTEDARLLATSQMMLDLVLLGAAARVLTGAVQEGVRQQLVRSGTEPSADDPPLG